MYKTTRCSFIQLCFVLILGSSPERPQRISEETGEPSKRVGRPERRRGGPERFGGPERGNVRNDKIRQFLKFLVTLSDG